MTEVKVNKNDIIVKVHRQFNIGPIEGKEAEKTMQKGCEIVKKLSYYFWITSGNLLGIYRDKKLIDHDTDIDICVKSDWHDPKVYEKAIELVGEMLKNKFDLVMSQVYQNRPMQLAFVDTTNHDVIFDIYFYYSGVEEQLINWNMEGVLHKPIHFVEKLGEIEFKGVTYPTPYPIEEFLSWRYGQDWRTPKKKKDPWQTEAKHIKVW